MLKYCVVGRFVYEVLSYKPKTGEIRGQVVYDDLYGCRNGDTHTFDKEDVFEYLSTQRDTIDSCVMFNYMKD